MNTIFNIINMFSNLLLKMNRRRLIRVFFEVTTVTVADAGLLKATAPRPVEEQGLTIDAKEKGGNQQVDRPQTQGCRMLEQQEPDNCCGLVGASI